MKILTNEQLREAIRRTAEAGGLRELDMIEHSAEAIAAEIAQRWRPNVRLVVFAGWGNNGADALETARLLAAQGYRPEIYLFNIKNMITPECRACRDRILQSPDSVTLYEIDGSENFSWPELDSNCLIVDGLFGSGLTKSLPVSFQLLVSNINNSGAPVVSIDIPSGMFGEWNDGNSLSHMVHATLTLALGAPRLAFLIADNAPALGEWKVLNIGLDAKVLAEIPYIYYLVQRGTVRQVIKPRKEFCSKDDFGTALLIAGSEGMMGAAVMAVEGALRAGAGKVVAHVPQCGVNVLQVSEPCAMVDADSNQRCISQMPTDNQRYTAVAVGPGIGTHDLTVGALGQFLRARTASNAPVILDADALNCIAARSNLIEHLPVLSVLTPHDGEFDRLFGTQKSHEARLRKALDVAAFYNVIIVLKGRYTAIVRPDGRIFFNTSGSPAMATGGSGDVLTGVICGFMAQGYKPEIAAFISCFIHGVAGEMAAIEQGEFGTTAMDIAANIGKAIASVCE